MSLLFTRNVLLSAMIIFLSLFMVCTAVAEAPVKWTTALNTKTNQLIVGLDTTVPLKSVSCQLSFLDKKYRHIATKTYNLTESDDSFVERNKHHIWRYKVDPNIAAVEDGLLIATPVLSSPKAVMSDWLNLLQKGIPALSHKNR